MSRESELFAPEFILNSAELVPARTRAEFDLHEAAVEWSLADPIIIASQDDIKSKPNWQERLKPFEHQIRNLITYCRRLPVTLLADDVGLGKTISAGLILSELMVRNRVRRALVVCPSILGPQWIEELEAKFDLFGQFAKGAELDRQLKSECPVVVTTYQSIQPRLASIQPGQFDMLILDEAHKLRNLHGTPKPPKLAIEIRKALAESRFPLVLMLTATPIQNRLWDLYSLVDCLTAARGRENPFGAPTDFSRNFIKDPSKGARRLMPGKKQEFQHILSQYLVRTRRNDCRLLFPKREVQLYRVTPSALDTKLQKIVSVNIKGLNGLQQSSIFQAMMSSPQALVAQLENMATRDERWRALAEHVESLVVASGLPSKMHELLRLIEVFRTTKSDWRLVIFTIRIETQRMICNALANAKIKFGTIQGGQGEHNIATVKRFTQQPPLLNVIVSTDAGSEGLNLQAGNVIVNYDLPWNPMIVEQRIGRVQRLASAHASVVIWNLAVAGSPEERVVQRLIEKLQTIVESVGDIEIVLAADDNDGAESGFESDIRRLIIKALEGKDVDRDTQLKVDSMARAKELFEQQRQDIDQTLGTLDAEHHRGPAVPKVTRQPPNRDHKSFALDVYRSEGFTIQDDPAGCLRADKPRQSTEFITFDDNYFREQSQTGVFNGKLLRLCLPGRPHFEKMVQRWVDRGAVAIANLTSESASKASVIAQDWLLAHIAHAEMGDVQILKRTSAFQGRCRLKATASTGVDSYEKLIDLTQIPECHSEVFSECLDTNTKWQTIESQPDELFEGFHQLAEDVCRQDEDVRSFCDFYSERLSEELRAIGNDAARIRKAKNDFQPKVHVQPTSVEGIHYETVRIDVSVQLDGHSGYIVELELCPSTGQVFDEPAQWATCEVTLRSVPETFLEACAISQKYVLRHLLVTSDESGRRALAEFTTVCPVTGRVALHDEFLISDVSGTRAVASRVVTSELSGRRGLLEESTTCEFTNICVLQDEVRVSEISGKRYRHDEGGSSFLSQRCGHVSEFVKCQFSNEFVLPDEVVISDFSRKLMRQDLVERSSRPPHRVGGPGEFAVCEVTGARFLSDELSRCEATGMRVDATLLQRSTSGRLALPNQLADCELTGDRLLPDEVAVSSVSGRRFAKRIAQQSAVSGKIALSEELVTCEVTGSRVLNDELATSEVSGKRFRRDEVVHSSKSQRVAHRSEATTCAASAKQLLNDEVLKSDVSGRAVDVALAVESPISGRHGLPDEVEACEFTNTKVLNDELLQSEVSGKHFRRDQAVESATSKRVGHATEAGRCEASGKTLLVDELVESDVSGKRFDAQLAYRSPVSGKLALRSECQRCEFSGDLVLPCDLIASDVSNRWLRRDRACRSVASGRIGDQTETASCDFTRRTLLCDEVGTSDFSGKQTATRDLISSDKSGRVGIKSEIVTCAATGKRLLKDEVAQSVVSHQWVDRDLLVPSAASQQLALPNEMVRCEVTGALLLPHEVARSTHSGRVVDRRSLVKSDLSSAYALDDELETCPISERRGLQSEFEVCEVTQQRVAADLLERCAVSSTRCLRKMMLQSVVSQRWLLPENARKDFRSGDVLCPDEAALCHWNDGYMRRSDTQKCRQTGLSFSSKVIGPNGEFVGIKKLLLHETEVFDGENLIPWFKKQLNGQLRSVAHVNFIMSKRKRNAFAWLDMQPHLGMWGRFNVLVVVQLESGKPKKLIGQVTKWDKYFDRWEVFATAAQTFDGKASDSLKSP